MNAPDESFLERAVFNILLRSAPDDQPMIAAIEEEDWLLPESRALAKACRVLLDEQGCVTEGALLDRVGFQSPASAFLIDAGKPDWESHLDLAGAVNGLQRCAKARRARNKILEIGKRLERGEDPDQVFAHYADDLTRLVSGGGDRERLAYSDGYTLSEVLAKDLPPIPSFLPDGLLPVGVYAVLHGPEGFGKTWLAMQLGLSISLGEPWLGIPCEKGKVAYIGSEMNEHMVKARGHVLMRLATPGGHQPLPGTDDFIFFTAPNFQEMPDLADAKQADRLAEALERRGVTVLILDPWSDFHSLNENDNTDMAKVVKNLNRITAKKITVILIHHDRKPAQGEGQDNVRGRMRGAVKVRTSAKTVMSLSEEQGHLRLEFSKVSCGPGREDIWLQEADGGGYVVGNAPPDLHSQRQGRLLEIVNILRRENAPLTKSELRGKLSFTCADRTIKDYLTFLTGQDQIKVHGKNIHTKYSV